MYYEHKLKLRIFDHCELVLYLWQCISLPLYHNYLRFLLFSSRNRNKVNYFILMELF